MKRLFIFIFVAVSVLFSVGMTKPETEKTLIPLLDTLCRYNEKEKELVELVVQEEVRGAGLKHKRIIANVILNRVESEAFPDSIEEVIFQRGQFTSARNCKEKNFTPDEVTKQAVSEVLNYECEDLSEGALYFYAPKYTNEKTALWFEENLEFLFELEGHRFFK